MSDEISIEDIQTQLRSIVTGHEEKEKWEYVAGFNAAVAILMPQIQLRDAKVKQTQDELKHALAYNRVRCKIEFWEAMLAPNLLVEANLPSTDSTESSAGSASGKPTDRKSERTKKKEATKGALKQVPIEVMERISQHARTWYWILTSNQDDPTVKQLLKYLDEYKISIVDFSKRMAGFFTVSSGPSHVVPKQYRKIKASEIQDIVDELGVEEPITSNSIVCLLKLG